jgi:Flp pilus assembly protein TadG
MRSSTYRWTASRTLAVRRGKFSTAARRAGAAVVEFAFVAPLLILLTMGMMEVGRMVMVKQLLVNATREGARLAVLPGATDSEVTSQVQADLVAASVNGATVTLSPASISSAPAGTPITVSASIPATAISWVPKPIFSFNNTLEASTTMRTESN